MPAYQLAHPHTGLSLYQVGDASEADIEQANANLAASGSEMRYLPIDCLAEATASATLERTIPLNA